jgi:magnesium transporter
MQGRKLEVMIDSLRRLIRRSAHGHIHNMLVKGQWRAVDIFDLFNHLSMSEKNTVFTILVERDKLLAAEVLSEMPPPVGVELLSTFKDEQIAGLLQELSPDDATEYIAAMPGESAARMLELMRDEEAREVQDLLQYDEETAGRIMTTEFFALDEDTLVKDAISSLRDAAETEMVFYLYVVDDRSHLIGVCSLRQLLLSKPELPLKQFMQTDVISATTDTDQEEVARVVSRYNLLAIPVTDENNRLVGVVTIDDVVDVIKEEATEDFYKMAGTSDEEILTKSVFKSARIRLPWLLASFFGGIVATVILSRFEGILSSFVMLTYFLPIIMGMGGNIGNQSSTIIVRGLATGRIDVSMLGRVASKEIRIAVVLGLSYGLLLGVIAFFLGLREPLLSSPMLFGAMVGIALSASMIIAGTIGSIIPMTLQKAGIDPAVATVPFVATSVDILGVLCYLGMAHFLLPVVLSIIS